MGADDCEANIIEVCKFTADDNETVEERAYFTLPADAVRDKEFMDWFLAVKAEHSSETNDAFNDLICRRHELRRGLGGVPVSVNDEYLPDDLKLLEGREDAVLRQLVDMHGKEYVESLSPQELFAQCKAISQRKAIE